MSVSLGLSAAAARTKQEKSLPVFLGVMKGILVYSVTVQWRVEAVWFGWGWQMRKKREQEQDLG